MKCNNCGMEITEDIKFCNNCGKEIIKEETPITEEVKVEPTPAPEAPVTPQVEVKEEPKKKSPILMIIIIAIVGVILFFGFTIGLILFFALKDNTSLKWDKEFGAYNAKYLSKGNIELAVKAYDKDNKELKDISFDVTCGEIVSTDGWKVTWNLPDENKKCTITAKAPSGKKIKKKIEVHTSIKEDKPAGISMEQEETEETDSDGDGITNFKEKELGLDPYLMDTDKDGLTDKTEIDYAKTDPLKYDTDEDGIRDGDELELGLDPLKKDSKGDGVNDGDRTLTYDYKDEEAGVSLKVTGKSNIASTTIDIMNISSFEGREGLLNKVYNFYSEGTFDSAEVRIKYDVNELTSAGISEDDVALYYFNETDKKLEKVETTVDKVNKEIVVTLKHFSKYVIGSTTVDITELKSDVVFVVDNSGSMYTDEQLHKAGKTSAKGMQGNDPNFRRIELTKNALDKFKGSYRYALIEFAGNYKVIQDFTTDKDAIKSKADSMKANWQVQLTGTNIVSALNGAINKFESDKNGHYVLLMTDGEDTTGTLKLQKDSIIQHAKAKNVKICVIGLGTKLDNDELNAIATETGCAANSVSKAEDLDQLYDIIGSTIYFGAMDMDGDGVAESNLMNDSGFITAKDGFSFPNPGYVEKDPGGQCYGMAFFASLFYQQKLPLKQDAKSMAKLGVFQAKTSNGYDLTNTYFADQTKNLYDYRSSNPIMRMIMEYDRPGDYRDKVENNVLKINEKYSKEMINLGWKISEKKNKQKGEKYDKYEISMLDIESESFKQNDNEDYQLFNAIYYYFMHQNAVKLTSFNNTPEKAWQELNDNIRSGIPQPISLNNNHEVNALRVYSNVTDSSKFVIEIYDNNYPGETKYIDVTRRKMNVLDEARNKFVNFGLDNSKYLYEFDYEGQKENIDVSYIE